MASPPISLFSTPAESRAEPLSVLLSSLMHGVVAAVFIFVIVPAPQIRPISLPEKYSVRLLLIHSPQPHAVNPDSGTQAISYPSDISHQASRDSDPSHDSSPLRSTSSPARLVVQSNTLSNIDLPQDLPIPTVLLVSQVDLPNQKIVAPPSPVQASADVKPILQLPNREQNVADIAVASTQLSANDSTVQASTTSPLRLQGANLEKMLPQTQSEASSLPTPPTVMVLSDIQLRNGTVVLPTAGQKRTIVSGTESQSASSQSLALNNGTPASTNGSGAAGATSPGIAVKRVTLPKDGRFSMVLVGNSMDEQYPEIAGIWGGRLAYTVYLHVGLAKNWILQYALPRADQAPGTGASGRLDAPWPTDIVVPNFPPGYTNSDALIVHGLLSKNGHFDQLKVVFPPQFSEARFVLDLLQRWVFRPATANGQITDVDVLLIIPEIED